tara:strand:+ start:161 stop:3493 length:3333 start_codon:yes stop_codon:yes gene_type:complete
MALTSPGVQVSVIDESFYTPAEPGTTPIIFVATAENKLNGAATGIAPGTLAASAGKVYLMTSQRDLVETFGDPLFYTDANNNPIHGGEQNEYGLQAAYSYLGVSNRAWVVRADVDLNAITASATATSDNPLNGTYWLDTLSTRWGMFEWNSSAITATGGQTFTNVAPIVITDVTKLVGESATGAPKTSIGAIGDYAIRATTTVIRAYYKNSSNAWVEVGSASWKSSWATAVGSISSPAFSINDKFLIDFTDDSSVTVEVTSTGVSLASLVSDINTNSTLAGYGVTAAVIDTRLEIYNSGSTSDSIKLIDGDGNPLAAAGITEGTFYTPALQISKHTSVPTFKSTDTSPRPTGSIWIKTTEPNLGARWRTGVFNSTTALWDSVSSPIHDTNHSAIYNLDRAGGGAGLTVGDLYVQSNSAEDAGVLANFKIFRRSATGATTITSSKITSAKITSATYTVYAQESLAGQESLAASKTISITATGASTDADVFAAAINAAGFTNVAASVDSQNRIVITHKLGGEIRFIDGTGVGIGVMEQAGFSAYDVDALTGTVNLYWVPGQSGSDPEQLVATLWKPLSYSSSDTAPTALAANGALWYNSIVDEVDLLVHDGNKWVGLLNSSSPYYDADSSLAPDAAGPIVAATAPVDGDRSDGGNLVTGDIWISTADLENYPRIYRWNNTLNVWTELDATDQTTENGVLFADARWSTNGGSATSHTAAAIEDLIVSDFVDADAPDPALYPKGMLLWNLRRSGFNVKRFERNYVDLTATNGRYNDASMASYYPHRWVTESANETNGKGSFGRKAQRKVVVQALQSLMNSNQDIRDTESRIFNLISTPAYPELIGEMISLNYDRDLTAFVVGDSPFRLTPDATSLNTWGTNVNLAVEDNDLGLVSRDEYMAVYYPSGFTSDNAGNNIVVPSSHMVLRTLALNDQVAYPWFAPAGTRRGGVTNATSVGYINGEGEFVSIALNEGQRDTLYTNNVNPITFLTGAGLVVFGQKTRARNASALDRVNVARLVIYLRSQLNQLAKPYLFEPNDKITRDEIKQQVESLMVELVGLRALYDFLVVCDESNNTPSRIDRNELYVDIAIEPVKAVEFIYIPLRIKNTGEIAGL